jgi:Na+-transporting methylmalonyl-CoA/oxaloacetate decarboxylase gamma subunit
MSRESIRKMAVVITAGPPFALAQLLLWRAVAHLPHDAAAVPQAVPRPSQLRCFLPLLLVFLIRAVVLLVFVLLIVLVTLMSAGMTSACQHDRMSVHATMPLWPAMFHRVRPTANGIAA